MFVDTNIIPLGYFGIRPNNHAFATDFLMVLFEKYDSGIAK